MSDMQQRKAVVIRIPEDLKFSDLALSRDPQTGRIEFDVAIVERISKASDFDLMRAGEDAISDVVINWYLAHLEDGGDPDLVAEQFIGEVFAEDERGPIRLQ